MRPTVQRVWIYSLAVAVGVAHGLLKQPPGDREVAALQHIMQPEDPWQGRYPPNVALRLLDGTERRLADMVGKKTLLVNFFATWCVPCRQEMPELESFYHKHRGEDLLMVGIDVAEPAPAVRRLVAELKLDFPVAVDDRREAADAFRVPGFPTSYLIGRDGRVALYVAAAIDNADIVLDRAFRHAARAAPISREIYLARLAAQPPLRPSRAPREGPWRGDQ